MPVVNFKADYPEEVRKKRKTWPVWAHLLGWVLVLLLIGVGVVMVYGFAITFGNEKTYQWVSSMIVALFTSVLIIFPLYVFIISCCISLWFRKANMEDDHADMDEEDPTIYWDPNNPPIRRPRKKIKRIPMKPDFKEQLQQTRIRELEMRTLVKELILYLFFCIVIFIVSYGNRDPNAFLEKEALQQAVIHGALNCGVLPEDDPGYIECDDEDVPEPYIDFMQVKDANEWWYWLEATLKSNVRVQQWYNGKQAYGLKGYMNDRVNRLIGYAIVRQVRERLGTCKPDDIMTDVIKGCTGDGGLDVEDDKDYCLNWILKSNREGFVCDEQEEYQYTTAGELESTTVRSGIGDFRRWGIHLQDESVHWRHE